MAYLERKCKSKASLRMGKQWRNAHRRLVARRAHQHYTSGEHTAQMQTFRSDVGVAVQ